MITDTEIDVEVEQILARISTFRQRVEELPGCAEATAIGFLAVGLEAAEKAMKAGHQCMKSEAGLPQPCRIDYDVEYGMTPIQGLV